MRKYKGKMNKKIRILYLIIVFSAIIGVGIVDAQEYTIEAALSSYGLEEPKVSILGNEVTIEYKQPVSEFCSMNEEFKKIAKILSIVADEHPTAYRVIIRQYFDDGQIMELVGKPEDGKAFLNNQISEETFSERLEFNPLTRGPPIIPGTCEPDKGENCENCVECVCYPNEFCDPTNPEADKKGCVVKYIPSNSQLVGSEYVCNEGYKWNSDLTGCVPENTAGGDSKYTTPKPTPTRISTPIRRETSTESTPAQEPTTQKECERWCSSKYGAGTPGMFFNIDGCLCRCREGYTTTAEGIVKISIEKCDQLCLDKFGIGSAGIFNSDEMCRCVCNEGYIMNEEKTGCIKITSTQTVKPTNQEECEKWCSQKYGAGTSGIFFNNVCACRCKEGYTEDGVKIPLEQCDQRCFDKFGTGHRGAFNPDEICKCVCEEGYTLNEAKTRCVKISPTKRPQTPAPTYSYDDDYTYDDSVPGFEAIYAIAGLLSVAYLVLRKRK
jgi:PGF-CTERM protein